MTNGTSTLAHDLVRQCLLHFECELAALEQLNDSMRAVRLAVKQHDTQHLSGLIEQQQSCSQHLGQVRQSRQQLRHRIAIRMGVPDNGATILDWAATLPPFERAQVLERRSQLATIAEEAAQLAQSNMAVVTHGLRILHEVRKCLTGDCDRSDRYLATGQPCSPGPQTLYNTRF